MAKTIDSIPEKTRWEMARSGMKQEREPSNLLIVSN
jgi:hypothetical protein